MAKYGIYERGGSGQRVGGGSTKFAWQYSTSVEADSPSAALRTITKEPGYKYKAVKQRNPSADDMMTGKSTGWMPAKAVRVVKTRGGARIDIKS